VGISSSSLRFLSTLIHIHDLLDCRLGVSGFFGLARGLVTLRNLQKLTITRTLCSSSLLIHGDRSQVMALLLTALFLDRP
jgi:hypothetical protein